MMESAGKGVGTRAPPGARREFPGGIHRQQRASGDRVAVTREQIAAYVAALSERGRVPGSVEKYRRDLLKFYQFLPQGKAVAPDTLALWRDSLLEQGYAPRTVNTCISAANSFLAWLGCRDLQLLGQLEADSVQPELTRDEYLRLLSTARQLDKERVYLLIKLFATTGITVQELDKVTVEGVSAGVIPTKAQERGQGFFLYSGLREELLCYARRRGVQAGPVFTTRDGKPILRSNVSDSIRALCRDAQVAPEKGNPRCLHKLYLETRREITQRLEQLARESYQRLLDGEQGAIGWK